MAVKLKDVAKKANVSISTVSRIINDDTKKPASQETKEKVWKIIKELGYIPNVSARNLVKGKKTVATEKKTKTIGCIFTSTDDTYNDPFFSVLVRGIQLQTTEMGYMLGYTYSTCNTNDSALYNSITSNNVDGLILMGRFGNDFQKFVKDNFKNLIYVGLNSVNQGFDEVICDAYKAVCCAVNHLISLGHKKIGYIGSAAVQHGIHVINEHRYEAFEDTLKKNNIFLNKNYIRIINTSTEEGYQAMYDIINNKTLPTAISCGNDEIAIGVIKAIRECNLRIPEDIAIIGIDDIEMAPYLRPSLSTIRIPKIELGKFAVKILIDRIEKGHKLPVKIEMPFELVVRKSCGKFI